MRPNGEEVNEGGLNREGILVYCYINGVSRKDLIEKGFKRVEDNNQLHMCESIRAKRDKRGPLTK